VPVDVCGVLGEVAAALQTRERVEVEVSCPEGLAVLGDRDLVEQILSNLALNAAKHTERGRIRMVARRLSEHAAAMEIVDSGTGIPEPERERIFERFFRGERRSEGYGLGLSIVREGVRVLGGSVEVESATAGGTTIRVTLPLAGSTV